MEKVGQIYKSIHSDTYFKIIKIDDKFITSYACKEKLNENWNIIRNCKVPTNYFIDSNNRCELFEDIKEEIIIPVSRLSKIE